MNIKIRGAGIWSILVLLVSGGCDWFERQHHELSTPVVPVFKVSGFIYDERTSDPVPGLALSISQFESYDGGWVDTLHTSSNEKGYFEFRDVPRGGYWLYIYLFWGDEPAGPHSGEGVLLDSLKFGIIQYQDRFLEIEVDLTFLPKIVPFVKQVILDNLSRMVPSGKERRNHHEETAHLWA